MKQYKKREKFNLDLFYKNLKNKSIKIKDIDNKFISNWLDNYSIRMIQKWKKENGINEWNKDSLKKFEIWYNRDDKKPKHKTVEKIKFITTNDIVDELLKRDKRKLNLQFQDDIDIYKEKLVQNIRVFCKQKNTTKEKHCGRNYYIITKELREEILKEFNYDPNDQIIRRQKKGTAENFTIFHQARPQKQFYNYLCMQCGKEYNYQQIQELKIKCCPYCGTKSKYKKVYVDDIYHVDDDDDDLD